MIEQLSPFFMLKKASYGFHNSQAYHMPKFRLHSSMQCEQQSLPSWDEKQKKVSFGGNWLSFFIL